MKKIISIVLLIGMSFNALADKLIIPMDATQKNHLKAYGIAYWVLEQQEEVEWLLNYKGGSFLMNDYENIEKECLLRGVSFSTMSETRSNTIKHEITHPSSMIEIEDNISVAQSTSKPKSVEKLIKFVTNRPIRRIRDKTNTIVKNMKNSNLKIKPNFDGRNSTLGIYFESDGYIVMANLKPFKKQTLTL